MELKLINEQGQEASRLQASDVLFGREYNEALIHQVVLPIRRTRVVAIVPRRIAREQVKHTTKPSRSVKRVPGVLVPVCRLRRCGVAVAGSSRIRRMRISARS
jgi:hypothetical protein